MQIFIYYQSDGGSAIIL